MVPPAAMHDLSSSGSEQHMRGNNRLCNDFKTKEVCWSPITVSTTGEQFFKTLQFIDR